MIFLLFWSGKDGASPEAVVWIFPLSTLLSYHQRNNCT